MIQLLPAEKGRQRVWGLAFLLLLRLQNQGRGDSVHQGESGRVLLWSGAVLHILSELALRSVACCPGQK